MIRHIKRCISISTSHNPVTGVSKTITTNESIQNVQKLVSNQTVDTPKLIPIDNSILSIELPPSIPVTVKRGSIISIYGVGDFSLSSVKKSLQYNPISNIIYGNFNLFSEHVLSTSKVSLLISSNQKSLFNMSKLTNTKSVSILNLDGTTDWAILNKASPSFVVGNSIILKNYVKPIKISKRLSRALSLPRTTNTGLFSLFNFSYQLVTGRGQVGVVGNGSIYNINLVEDEEILINKKNLLAVSVSGPHDLQNCVIDFESKSDTQVSEEVVETDELEPAVPPNPLSKYTVRDYLSSVGYYFRQVMELLGVVSTKTTNYILGNQDFVKILGPRNILIQSDTNFKIPEVPQDSLSKSLKTFQRKSSDYLNYVRLDSPKKVISTPDFKEDKVVEKP